MNSIFHNPKIQQVSFLDSRYYTDDGVTYFPSITTCLDAYPKGASFNEWLKATGSNAVEIADIAAREGSRVHDAIEKLLKGEMLMWAPDGVALYNESEWIRIMRFNDFYSVYKPKVIAVEQKFISHKYQVGGTIDLICEIDNIRWAIDYKAGKYIHPSHELQIAAYATCWNELFPDTRVDRTGILHLQAATRGAAKTGKSMQGLGWKLSTEDDFKRPFYDAFKIYENVRVIWNQENPNYKPKNLIYPDRLQIASLQPDAEATT